MPVRPADDNIKLFHPSAIGIVNDTAGHDVLKKKKLKKITYVFNCMTCAAPLELDETAERTIKCRYCNSDNYLPDDVWETLNPYEPPKPFFWILDIKEEDIRESFENFLNIKEFNKDVLISFIEEYFNNFFLNDSVKVWWKILLNHKLMGEELKEVGPDPETTKWENFDNKKDAFFTSLEDAMKGINPDKTGNLESALDDLANSYNKLSYVVTNPNADSPDNKTSDMKIIRDIFFKKLEEKLNEINPEFKYFISQNIVNIPDNLKNKLLNK
jgi:hypothetical protein